MASRDETIVTAAQDLFMRYGFGRTTMADIAQSAGVARQTLYNAYPNKDAVLQAVVRASIETDLASVLEAWQSAPDLSAKIDRYYEQGPIAWYDLVENAPDAAEMVDGLHQIAKDEVADGMRKWTHMFTALFAEAGVEDAEAFADFFISSSKSAKYDAADRETLLQRLAYLKSATLGMITA